MQSKTTLYPCTPTIFSIFSLRLKRDLGPQLEESSDQLDQMVAGLRTKTRVHGPAIRDMLLPDDAAVISRTKQQF